MTLGIRLDFATGTQRLGFTRLVADLEQRVRRGTLAARYLAA